MTIDAVFSYMTWLSSILLWMVGKKQLRRLHLPRRIKLFAMVQTRSCGFLKLVCGYTRQLHRLRSRHVLHCSLLSSYCIYLL